ncbi:MAG: hypothetical protein AB7I41_11710 [Candidatus Sericytochromatia bacterium]
MHFRSCKTTALILLILAGFSASPIQAQPQALIVQNPDLLYQGQVALARDWANAFQKMGLKQVRVKVQRASANISASAGTSLPPNLLLDTQVSVYNNVTQVTDIGALLLIQYELPLGLSSVAVIRSDQILGLYP